MYIVLFCCYWRWGENVYTCKYMWEDVHVCIYMSSLQLTRQVYVQLVQELVQAIWHIVMFVSHSRCAVEV